MGQRGNSKGCVAKQLRSNPSTSMYVTSNKVLCLSVCILHKIRMAMLTSEGCVKNEMQ